MSDQQKQARDSKGGRMMYEGEYIPQVNPKTVRKWMRYWFLYTPIINRFGNWLLDNPGELEELRKLRDRNLTLERPSESHE